MFSQLLQLPPLQNKPFWIYIWDLPFFFYKFLSQTWIPWCWIRIVEWNGRRLWHSCALPSLDPVNQNEKNGPRFCLAFMCCRSPAVDAFCPLHWARMKAKLGYGQSSSYARSWIFNAGMRRINLQRSTSYLRLCATWTAAYLRVWL